MKLITQYYYFCSIDRNNKANKNISDGFYTEIKAAGEANSSSPSLSEFENHCRS